MAWRRFGARGWAKWSVMVTAAAVAAVLLAPPSAPAVAAQTEASPVPSTGSGRELLLQASLERTSDEPATLSLLRITLEPGGRSPLHAHPGVEFGVVETGQLAVQVSGRAVTLPATAGSAAGSEIVPEGVELTLGAGDRIAYAAGAGMTFRNPGPDATTLLVATVLPAGPDAPPGVVYPGGTPTADDALGVTSRLLGEAVADRLPAGRAAITLERLTLGAGSGLPGYAGPVLIAVERGGVSGAVVRDGSETNGDSSNDDGSRATPSATEEFRLVAGEAIFLPEGMAETPPLGGEGDVVLLRLGVAPLPEEVEPEETAEAEEEAESEATEEPTEDAAAEDADPDDPLGEGARVVVAVAEARLRAGPSVEADVVAGLEQGRLLSVVGPAETDDAGQLWLPIEDAEDPSLTGYVAADLLVPEEDAG